MFAPKGCTNKHMPLCLHVTIFKIYIVDSNAQFSMNLHSFAQFIILLEQSKIVSNFFSIFLIRDHGKECSINLCLCMVGVMVNGGKRTKNCVQLNAFWFFVVL